MKKDQKLTPWFPGHIKPEQPGVYECAGPHEWELPFPYHIWDGQSWVGDPGDTPESASGTKQLDDSYTEQVICYWRCPVADPTQE